MAKEYNFAMVGIRHLTKGNKDRSIYRGEGGIGFTGASRNVVIVGKDPNNPERRALVQHKTNIGKEGRSIGYSITDGVFGWIENTNLTADQILATGDTAEEQSALDAAKEFVRSMLAEGPRRSETLKKDALQADISYITLRRAKVALKVRHYRAKLQGEGGKMAIFCELTGTDAVNVDN